MKKAVVALAWVVAGIASAASAQVSETCTYSDARLARECRNDPGLRAYLMEPENRSIRTWMDLPPVMRGWEAGEEETVTPAIRQDERDERGSPIHPNLTNEQGPFNHQRFLRESPQPDPQGSNLAAGMTIAQQGRWLRSANQLLVTSATQWIGSSPTVDIVRMTIMSDRQAVVMCGRGVFFFPGRANPMEMDFILHTRLGELYPVHPDVAQRWCGYYHARVV